MNEINELLGKWELSHLKEQFEENGINSIDLLMVLEGENLKELIPKLGERIKFELERKKYINDTVTENSLQQNIIGSEIIFYNQNEGNKLILPQVDVATASDSPGSSSTFTLYSSASSNSNESLVVSDTTTLPISNDLKKRLESDLEGLEILASFKQNCLSRKKLVNFIINAEFRGSEDFRICTSRFEALAQQIVEVFPGENKETYYIPFHQEHGKKILAKGKLWDRYHNKRKCLKTLGLVPTRNKANSTTSFELNSNSEYDISEEINDKLLWLNHNISPWTTVEVFWFDTTEARKNSCKTIDTVEGILKLYPALKQPLGYTLIDTDFNNLYPTNCQKFMALWPDISRKIIKIIKKRNGIGNSILLKYKYTQNSEPLIALIALPYHLNLTKIKAVKWRPSKIESANAFILHLKTPEELLPYLNERKEKYASLQITAQPFTIFIGEDLDNIIAAYVSVNDILYKIETPLKAVDITFKTFHFFNAKYPVEREHVWTYLQKFVYNITTRYDNNYTSVNSLVSDINNAEL